MAIDFAGDNTADGNKDYAKVYVKTDRDVKEFKVSEPETRWGRPGFTYTDRVNYQHKVYEFKIPLKEIADEKTTEKSNKILLSFSAYGTLFGLNYIYEALIDADNNPATGGNVTIVQGAEAPHDEPGIDYIVAIFFDNDTGILGPTLVVAYQGGVFQIINIDNSFHGMGFGNGYNGSSVAEFRALKSLLGNHPGTMKIIYHATTGVTSDYTSPIIFQQHGIPSLSEWGMITLTVLLSLSAIWAIRRRQTIHKGLLVLIIVCSVTGLAWAATIVLDGNVDDWAGIPPAVTDPVGDSSIGDNNEDIVAGFITSDTNYFYFRMDTMAGPPLPPF